jgi:hypothetical protein
MRTIVASTLVLCLLVLSCKKDKKTEEPVVTPPPTTTPVPPAFGLKKGNWWVYTCTSASATSIYDKDSLVITKDSGINGKTYVQFKSFPTPYTTISIFPLIGSWVRDSGNYIVDNKGRIIASSNSHVGIFDQDSIFYMTNYEYKYEAYELAGTFTINCNSTIYQSKVNVRKVIPNPFYNYSFRNYYQYLSSSTGYVSFETGIVNDTNYKWNCKLLHYHIQ